MYTTAEIPLDLQIMHLLSDMARENAGLADLKTGTYFDYTAVIGDLSYAYSLISNKFYPSAIYRVKSYDCQDIQAAAEVGKMLVFFARYLVNQYRGEYISPSAVNTVKIAKQIMSDSARCPRPTSLPAGLPWSEHMSAGFDDQGGFDLYAYDGTMTVEDYEKAQKDFLEG